MADGALFGLPAHRLGVRIEMRGEDRSGGWSRSSSGRVVTRVYRWRAVAMVNGADFVGPWRDLQVDATADAAILAERFGVEVAA